VITAVDTNILLDLLIPEAPYATESNILLDDAHAKGSIIISDVVYVELAALFSSHEELQLFLSDTGIRLEHSQPSALLVASEAWRSYTARRHQGLQCSRCWEIKSLHCSNCGAALTSRQHVLPDFLIGGHASIHADWLLTRDRGYYRTYFPNLRLQQ